MEFYKYFYFIGITIFLPVWMFLFAKNDKRKDMLLIGILVGIAAVVTEHVYAKFDYWLPTFLFPKFPFEDFLYGFIWEELALNYMNCFLKGVIRGYLFIQPRSGLFLLR